MKSLNKKLLLLIIILAALTRFYKIDWGEGYFFHPDEYHIAISVNQLSFPDQMHPHFFSYGTFTSYLIYFVKQILIFFNFADESIHPILIGRTISALFSTLTIPLIFLLTKKLINNSKLGLLAAAITALSPGLIQQAHYTTPESIMIFWILLSIYLIFKWMDSEKIKYLISSAISIGLALSVKISAAIFTIPLTMAIFIKNDFNKKRIAQNLVKILTFLIFASITFLIVYPYSVIDWDAFIHSMRYETGVGRGDPLVFYTRQFINTAPILFQYQKILPHTLDPMTLLLGTPGVFVAIVELFKSKQKKKNRRIFIIVTAFLLFFIPSAFLFAKWTRFIIPALPFLIIFAAIFIDSIKNQKFQKILAAITLASSFLWMWMFTSIYRKQDVRLQTNQWIQQNIPRNANILTETGNMVEVPIGGNYQKIAFDFYHLDENPKLQRELVNYLENADYFIVQSRRIYANHQRLPAQFPVNSMFYDLLFSGQLGFTKINEFRSYPVFYLAGFELQLADENAEETWSVFDHPVLRIYKKQQDLTAEEYGELLGIKYLRDL